MPVKIIGPNDPALDVLTSSLHDNPGLNASLQIIPWPEYRQELMNTLDADTARAGAVFVPGHIWLPELAQGGKLARLDDLLPSIADSIKSGYNADDIIAGVQQESSYRGHQYLLPFFSDGHLLFYRSDLIDLDDSSGIPFVSTKDLLDMAQAVHNPDKVYGLALKADASEILTDWLPYLWEAGGKIFDDNGRPVLNSAANISALAYYCGLRSLCPPQTHQYGNGEIAESLRKGEAALVANWGGQTGPIMLDESNEWRDVYKVAIYPRPWNATWGIAVSANMSEEQQIDTLATLMQVLSPEQDRAIIETAGSPVRDSSYSSEALEKYPWLAAQRTMLDRAVLLPAQPELGLFLGDLYGAVHQAFIGEISPSEALNAVQEKALNVLA